MAEIEITLPTVQYGNVKVRATPEELGIETVGDAAALGAAAAVYLNVFTQGFKLGSQVDVSATVKAPQMPGVEEAARLLDEGLGGVTEVRSVEQIMSDEDVDTIEQARKIQESELKAPWEQPAVDAKPKPWETEATAPKAVVTSEW